MCDLAFLKLSKNILLIQKSTDPKILSAGSSGHIYEQLSLVTFFDSGYFGKSTVEDGKLGQIWVLKSPNLNFWRENQKSDYWVNLAFLGHLDDGKSSEILKS